MTPPETRIPQLLLTAVCLILGILLVIQLRTERGPRTVSDGEEWQVVVADLVEGNARLREEVKSLEAQLAQFAEAEGGGSVMESLVDEVNHLRIANGLVEVSGPGIEVQIFGPISVLDLHDLINELRNAGAEGLALNEKRLVALSAIGTDGEHVTVDGTPIYAPYRVQAIGDAVTLERALSRRGGLVDLLSQAKSASVRLLVVDRLVLLVYDQPLHFAYAKPQK